MSRVFNTMQSSSLLINFNKLYSGVIYDSMKFDIGYNKPFVLNKNIKPLWNFDKPFFGKAFTCRGEKVVKEIDDYKRLEAFKSIRKGQIYILDAGGDESVAHFGDITAKIIHRFGCAGAVIDGYTRDIKFIEKDRFPIFGKGIQPIDAYGRWQLVDYSCKIKIKDVIINPQDYIYGDKDGVLVLPHNLINDIVKSAEERMKKEDKMRRFIKKSKDLYKMYDEIGRW